MAGCWAHARRKFIDADKAAPKPKKGKPVRATKAKVALAKIAKLYAIEQRCKEKTPQERYQIRQEQARPLIDEIKSGSIKILSNPHTISCYIKPYRTH